MLRRLFAFPCADHLQHLTECLQTVTINMGSKVVLLKEEE